MQKMGSLGLFDFGYLKSVCVAALCSYIPIENPSVYGHPMDYLTRCIFKNDTIFETFQNVADRTIQVVHNSTKHSIPEF